MKKLLLFLLLPLAAFAQPLSNSFNAIIAGTVNATTNFFGEAGGLTEALAPTNSTQLATKAYVDAAIPSTFTYFFYGSSNNTTMSGLVQPLRSTNWAYASPASLNANTNTISSATNATYIAAYVTADTFRQLSSGNVNMDIYASFNTGAGRAAAIHPEIYLYDTVGNSNIIEFPNAPPDQSLSGTLSLYTFSVAITNFTWTNPFRVICKVKATTTNLPDISLVTQSNFTSHIDFNVPGGVFVQKAGDTMTGTLIGPTGEFADLRTGTLINTNGTIHINGITYTFPSTNAVAGQILQNDGAGLVTWTNVTAAAGGTTNMMVSTISCASATLSPTFAVSGLSTTAASCRRLTMRCTLTNSVTTVSAVAGTLIDGDTMVWELIQDGTGNETITGWDTSYAFGTDITGITLSTGANVRDFITWVYNSTAGKFYCVGFVRGY